MYDNDASVIIPRSSNYPFNTAYIPPAEVDRINKQLEVVPEVSIILPCYNAHNTLKRTLCSIAMQENIDEIETIIADDCSDIPYDHICQQFAHMMKIRIVRMKKNGGPGAARQVGFDHSHGKYVMWMDADDTLVSADTILTLKNVLIQKDMDCVYGKFLEQNEDGSIYPHEQHMVWMFGKLYRRSFLEKYNIRFNTSLSNEDTGFNCVVKGCSERIWYIPKDVYIWHFKANSITRIRQGMYGQDSGYKGYLDNMVWQIKELQKRFINKNYILNEIVAIYCCLYHFHVENMQRYPMNTEISLNWIRGYYELVMRPYEEYITETLLLQTFANVAANQNIAAKGIIPTVTFHDFHEMVKSKPMIIDPSHEICGATPAGHIPEITSPDWPVEITDYFDQVEGAVVVDSDTNKSRYGGMKRALGIELDETDYQADYTGTPPSQLINSGTSIINTKTDHLLKDYSITNNHNIPSTFTQSIIPTPEDVLKKHQEEIFKEVHSDNTATSAITHSDPNVTYELYGKIDGSKGAVNDFPKFTSSYDETTACGSVGGDCTTCGQCSKE